MIRTHLLAAATMMLAGTAAAHPDGIRAVCSVA
jgi:hypothetical protein